jgi:hypothetical protein
VQRIEQPTFLELMLDFGATVEAAKANNNGDLVIMQRASDDVKDELPHVVFNHRHGRHGGGTEGPLAARWNVSPSSSARPIWIGMGIDPAGNHFEMIQQPKKQLGATLGSKRQANARLPAGRSYSWCDAEDLPARCWPPAGHAREQAGTRKAPCSRGTGAFN